MSETWSSLLKVVRITAKPVEISGKVNKGAGEI
jgi:hypothetical protein